MIHSEFRKLSTVRGPWLLLAAGPLIVIAGITGLVASGGNVHDPADAVHGARPRRPGRAVHAHLRHPRRGGRVPARQDHRHLPQLSRPAAGSSPPSWPSTAWPARPPAWSPRSWRSRPRPPGGRPRAAPSISRRPAPGALSAAAWPPASPSPRSASASGALIRNLAAAVAVALAWIALVEGIAGQLLGSGLARWLPFYASEALDRASLYRGAPAAPAVGRRTGAARVRRRFAAAAVITTLRRDVT